MLPFSALNDLLYDTFDKVMDFVLWGRFSTLVHGQYIVNICYLNGNFSRITFVLRDIYLKLSSSKKVRPYTCSAAPASESCRDISYEMALSIFSCITTIRLRISSRYTGSRATWMWLAIRPNRGGIAQRQKHGADAHHDYPLAHPDELGIMEFHRQKSVQCPSVVMPMKNMLAKRMPT